MQVTRFLIHDRFIHCNTFSAKHFTEEEFFISRGMLFQMTGPEYERLSLKNTQIRPRCDKIFIRDRS